jgi:L-arabinose isomerase
MEINLEHLEVWFITGSQDLYGEETLRQVAINAKNVADHLDSHHGIPVRVVYKPIVKNSDEIYGVLSEANLDQRCIGLITWMHTFSPAKMWIRGLKALRKPLLHLHTQYNRDIPWDTIDMDFMNLNQSAHGDLRLPAGMIGREPNLFVLEIICAMWLSRTEIKLLLRNNLAFP